LTEAAKTSGRSISEEIESRLERSFSEEKMIETAFGRRDIFDFLRIVAAIMAPRLPRDAEGQVEGGLFNDPVQYDRAVKVINKAFEALRPDVEVLPPDTQAQLIALLEESSGRIPTERLNQILSGNAGRIFERMGMTPAEAKDVMDRAEERLRQAKAGEQDKPPITSVTRAWERLRDSVQAEETEESKS
jgi:hypothetical protein